MGGRKRERAMASKSAKMINFSSSSFPKKLKNVFWGSFGCEKFNSKEKKIWVRTFKTHKYGTKTVMFYGTVFR